jgi:hypothetical protein
MNDIKIVPIESIRPHDQNVKEHTERSTRALADSLRKFGQRRPIVINRDSQILSGHGLHQAAMLIGLEEVSVIECDDDEAAQLRWMVTDNRTAQLSRWRAGKLREVLDKIGRQTALFTADELNAIDNIQPLERRDGSSQATKSWMHRRAPATDTVPCLVGDIEMRLDTDRARRFADLVRDTAKAGDKPVRQVGQEIVEAWIDSL